VQQQQRGRTERGKCEEVTSYGHTIYATIQSSCKALQAIATQMTAPAGTNKQALIAR
jgi:hypothetical protein